MAVGDSNRIQTTTLEKYMPKAVDTVLNSNVFATRMLKKAREWSGRKYRIPVKIEKNTNSGSFSGFDVFTVAASDTRRNMEYDFKSFHQTVTLPLDEITVNDAADTQVLELVGLEVASSAEDMADSIGTVFYGDGTGNSGKDFLGLGAIVDDGSSVATIGGLSRSTFPTLASTVTSSATLSLAAMRTLYYAITSGGQRPTVGISNETVFALYESLLFPQERYATDAKDLVRGTGALELFFKGFPLLPDEKATAQTLFFLNENYIDWRARTFAQSEAIPYKLSQIEGNDYTSQMKGLGFSWTGWIRPTNSASLVGHILLGGELMTSNPKRHGKLTNVAST